MRVTPSTTEHDPESGRILMLSEVVAECPSMKVKKTIPISRMDSSKGCLFAYKEKSTTEKENKKR